MADFIVVTSEMEKDLVEKSLNVSIPCYAIGHTMETDFKSSMRYNDRNGILFIGSFNKQMYYNGDAIWYFLKNIFPLVLKLAPAPIPLLIAGRDIPQFLQDMVRNTTSLTNFVSFMDSPHDITQLHDKARLFIAPHLYGAGVQYKLSEVMSAGLPTVMSLDSAKNFGIPQNSRVSCVGVNDTSFANCVVNLYNNEQSWSEVAWNARNFIQQTHDRRLITKTWNNIFQKATEMVERKKRCSNGCPSEVIRLCRKGELTYFLRYPGVKKAVKKKEIPSAYEHWKQYGKYEGKKYECEKKSVCMTKCIANGILSNKADIEIKKCEEGEVYYFLKYPEVKNAVEQGIFNSAHEHWKNHGYKESRIYPCTIVNPK